ncbi:hypothetical protein A2U01_0096038, partial [Trifolium medium]|nr:hypothetical protein [Trifolium medium]
MAEPPAQLNAQSDEPSIGNDVVVAPIVSQALVVYDPA